MVMVFASTLRSLRMLQATRFSMFQGPQANTFHEDLRVIAESSDFERALSFDERRANTAPSVPGA